MRDSQESTCWPTGRLHCLEFLRAPDTAARDALDNFRGSQEAQDCGIAFGQRAAAFFREKRYALGHDSRAQRDGRAGNTEALQEGASSDLA